jgi:hypothetical protein
MSGVFIQPSEFLIFAFAGAAAASVYALFWTLRHFFKSGGLFETLADLVFTLFSTAFFLFCLTEMTDGGLRFFYFIAYFLTFSLLLLFLNTFKAALIAFFKSAAARIKKSSLFIKLSASLKKLKAKAAEREEARNRRFDELKKLRQEKSEKNQKEKEKKAAEKTEARNRRFEELKKLRKEKSEKNQKEKEKKAAEREELKKLRKEKTERDNIEKKKKTLNERN